MCFCLVFLTVSCTAVYLPPLPKLILTGLFLLSAIVVGVFGNKLLRKIYDCDRIKPLLTVLLSCASLAFGISFLTFDLHAEKFSEKVGLEDTVTLEITEVVYTSEFGARYYAKVIDSDIFNENFRIILDHTDRSYLPRDRARGTIIYKALQENVNGFDEQRYALSQKILLAADPVSLSYSDRNNGFSLYYFFTELNQKLCRIFYRYVGEEDGALSAALLFGRKDELPDPLKRDFKRLGLLHIICLSGAHLAILSTLLENILLKLRVKRKVRSILNIAAVILYMALTGFPPSLTRAGIMLIITNLAFFAKRTPDHPTSLSLACAMILLFNPYSALDYGLHLSFAAAHSCYISSIVGHRFTSLFTIKKRWHFRKVRKLCNRIIRYIMSTVVYNLVITVNILPLTFLYYGEMSLFSLPANLVYLPLITLLMYVGLLFLILAPFVVFSAPLAHVIAWLTSFISSSAEYFSSFRGIMLGLNYWFTPLFMLPVVVLIALSFSGYKKTIRKAGKISICVFAAFLAVVGLQLFMDSKEITAQYVTKGKNDGFLVKTGGQLMICEISDASYSFASNLVSHRLDTNSTEIEAYMLTHYHKKHIATLAKLTDNFIVRTLILPVPITETDTDVFTAVYSMCREKKIALVLTDSQNGDTVYFNGVEADVYPYTLLSRSTHPVIALRLSTDEQEIMYLGGSFNEGDRAITHHASEAEYLIFGGHSPVYKKVFDPQIAESKTVYLSEYAKESLGKLSPDITEELITELILTPEMPIRLH